MEHHFNVEIAEKYGILEAILLNNFYFWIKKNEANDKNFHEGRYWTYNSAKALHRLFPYASERKIRSAIKHLEDEGMVLTGNYNNSAYDRTMWYALTENATCILQNRQMEEAETSNESCKNVTPIPDNKTDKNTDNKTDIYKEQVEQIVNYLNEVLGTEYRPTTKKTRDVINARLKEGFTVEDFKTVIYKKAKQWVDDPKMCKYLRPETLFSNKFEGYLNEKEPLTFAERWEMA
ncbi:MAG: conserved phage C-terminal domain-containing protein [Bacteroidaceae bacterium]|nr:conserved phage C-terminal domain-containing protein [Bacteroidaceae bacterium]